MYSIPLLYSVNVLVGEIKIFVLEVRQALPASLKRPNDIKAVVKNKVFYSLFSWIRNLKIVEHAFPGERHSIFYPTRLQRENTVIIRF